MAKEKCSMISLVIITIMLVPCMARAQSNCAPIIAILAPCLVFMTGNSSTPSSSCCNQFSGAAQTQAQCLCTFVDGAPTQLPFAINQTKTLSLPAACKVQASPLSSCKASGTPASEPKSSSSTTSSSGISTTSDNAGSGSKTVPVAGQKNTSSAQIASNSASFILFFFCTVSTITAFAI